MEINEALDNCLASLMAPSERLLAMAMQLSRESPAPAAPVPVLRPVLPEADPPRPAGPAARNRAVLGHAHAVLSQVLGQLGGRGKD